MDELENTSKTENKYNSNTLSSGFKIKNLEDHLDLALRHHSRGELSRAEAIYIEILKNNPDQPTALHLQGVIAHQTKNSSTAEKLIKKALLIDPNYAEAHNNLGVVLKDQKRFEEALSSNKRAVQVRPDYAEGHYNLGVLLKDMGRLNEAVTSYREALSYNSNYADAHYNLGNTLNELGKTDEAIASFRKTIEIRPDHRHAYSNLGNLLKLRGNPSEAVDCYRKAIAIKPDFAEAHSNLGAAYKELGNLNDAEICYQKAIEIKPNFVEALGNLGNVLHGLDKRDEAISCLRKAIALQPDSPSFQHRLDSLLGNTTDCAPKKYVKEVFNSYANKFDDHLVNKLKYNTPTLLKEALNDLSWGEKKYENAIDLGCGTGLSGLEFRDRAETLIGIDLSENMISKAEAKNIYDALYVDDIIPRLNVLNTRFDLFISCDVFVYIGDLLPLFRCVKEHSTQNCVFVFSTEHIDGEAFVLRDTCRYAHSKDYILSVASTSGFKVNHFKETHLRYEKDGWVTGGIYVLEGI